MSSLTETYTGEIPSSPSAPKCNGFEQLVLKSLDQILTGQDKLKKDLETFKLDITKSVEFQGKEIEDLKKETKEIRKSASLIENKVDYTNDRTYANRQHIANLWREINRLERQTRRNNIRIIGVPESDGENVMEIVEGIISEIGLEDNVEVERAHRDGKVR